MFDLDLLRRQLAQAVALTPEQIERIVRLVEEQREGCESISRRKAKSFRR